MAKKKTTKIEVQHTGVKLYEGNATIYKSKKLGEIVIVLQQKSPIYDVKLEED